MAGLDNKILVDFLRESKTLVEKMLEILGKCEGNFKQVKSLENYAMNADRIMGAARSIAMEIGDIEHPVNKVGDYAAICKLVGFKASNIQNNETFYDICVALLLDGTEVLKVMLDEVSSGQMKVKELISVTFIERLRWVSSQFGAEYSAGVDIHKGKNTKLSQGDIDDLLKKLGFD